MGFLGLQSKNKLDLFLTDHGKKMFISNGQNIMSMFVYFGFGDGDIDYRQTTGTTYNDMSLSGLPSTVFYDLTDIRGARYSSGGCRCGKATSQKTINSFVHKDFC